MLSSSCGSTEIHDAQLGNGLPFFKLLNIKDTVVIPMKPMFQLAPYPLRFNAPHKTLISKTASHKKVDAIPWSWWLQCEEDKYNTALTDFHLHVMIYREAMHLNTIGCITEKGGKIPENFRKPRLSWIAVYLFCSNLDVCWDDLEGSLVSEVGKLNDA